MSNQPLEWCDVKYLAFLIFVAGNLTGLGAGPAGFQNKNIMRNGSGTSIGSTGRSNSPMTMGATSPMGAGTTPAAAQGWMPSPKHQPARAGEGMLSVLI